MPKAIEVYEFIDSFAPFDAAMDFDNVGILVGSGSAGFSRALITLDVTQEVIAEARRKSAQLIVSHHPIIFNPLRRIPADSLVYELIQSGITVISAHTNLDLSAEGTNTAMFHALRLENREKLGIDGGLLGELKKPLSASVMAELVKKSFNCSGLRFSDCGKEISRIALVAGAGGEGVFAAAEKGAQAFVTGEIKHHEILFARQNGIAIFDVGHSKCEELVLPSLCEKLSGRFPEAEFSVAQSYTDGIRYLGKH